MATEPLPEIGFTVEFVPELRSSVPQPVSTVKKRSAPVRAAAALNFEFNVIILTPLDFRSTALSLNWEIAGGVPNLTQGNEPDLIGFFGLG